MNWAYINDLLYTHCCFTHHQNHSKLFTDTNTNRYRFCLVATVNCRIAFLLMNLLLIKKKGTFHWFFVCLFISNQYHSIPNIGEQWRAFVLCFHTHLWKKVSLHLENCDQLYRPSLVQLLIPFSLLPLVTYRKCF